jgi:hypothetical protein
VAYVDILGFKERVKVCPPEQVRNDLKFAQRVGRIARGSVPGLREFRFKAFSDNVSMSVPVNRGNLVSFLLHMVQFQAQLANRAVFVRGAIVIGKHFENGGVLFGRGLIRAVELEETTAVWPRIIVDSRIVSLAYRLGLYLDTKPLEGDVVPLLRSDYDGIRYINYLGHFSQSPQWHDSPKESEKFVGKHRDSVVGELESNQSNPRVLAQYHWLAAYHNSIVSEVGWHHLDIDTSEFLGL